ncbi:DUF58 domain-containing protein [Ruegeria meonggei]|uniref:DUF58 domain-containing protein n=1 Tax=Ruegeria meonggei TaxID=1446476 RepID=A0A1X7ACM4_9RHOB|nr:DUF58 domain-containing protein [Ruegeria meonggei]SLN75432.1 hypothetical protein RUM8411_04198 [Ruegeria meonggei]
MLGDAARTVAGIPWLLLGGIAAADLLLSWPRRRTISVDPVGEVFVGESFDIVLDVSPRAASMRGQLSWPDGLTGPSGFDLNSGSAKIQGRAVRRGNWVFSNLWLYWPSRLSLFEFVPKTAFALEVAVVPNIRRVQSGEISTTVQSRLFGVKENRAIGEGTEFHQLRDFVQGMDASSIDWKRSARHRSLVAKEVRAERNHHVIIALDNGYQMREEIAGLPKIDHAITAALATAWAAAIGGDLVGMYAYDAEPRLFLPPEPGRAAFTRLRSRTAELRYESRETNHTLAMTELNRRTPKRSLIIVFSDFIDTTSAELMVENIGVLAKRHLIVFVALRDPILEAQVRVTPADMDGVAETVSTGQLLQERRLVLERLHQLGVTIIDAEPGHISARLISTYLEIKAREMI